MHAAQAEARLLSSAAGGFLQYACSSSKVNLMALAIVRRSEN